MIRRNFEFIASESVSQSVPSTENSAAIGLPLRVTTTGWRRAFRAYRFSASGALLSSRVFKLHYLSAYAKLLALLDTYGKYLHRRFRFHDDIVEDAKVTNSYLPRSDRIRPHRLPVARFHVGLFDQLPLNRLENLRLSKALSDCM